MQVKSHTYNYFSDTISEVLTNFLSLLPWFRLVIYHQVIHNAHTF